jgi:hypothetical protein
MDLSEAYQISNSDLNYFSNFSVEIIFQQVTQRMVTHCAGGFLGVGLWSAGLCSDRGLTRNPTISHLFWRLF